MKEKARSWPPTAVPPTPVPEPKPTRTPSEWAVWLKGEALRIGFSSAGISSAAALFSRDAQFRAWLDRGRAGPLDYMRDFFERRERFLRAMPDLKSILALTVPYSREGPRIKTSPSGPAAARIARYAAGRDYHRVIRKMLRKLSASVRQAAGEGIRLLSTVDTSPISERAVAEAAGLGFFGKNSCLIQPRGGSYFFLAALLTDLDLPADRPIRWDCGSCTLCLDACPTGALEEPYQLNAARCISSLTIEQRATIPIHLRPLIQEWLFGCDICQEVCPYNHGHPPASPLGLKGAGKPLPTLTAILQMRSDPEFQQTLTGSPLKRPGRAGLLRNAAIVAANLHRTDLIPPLQEAALHDPSAIVRDHADWALHQLQKTSPAVIS